MASRTDWKTDTTVGAIGYDLTKNNRSGFSALPGGVRSPMGSFSAIGVSGNWWSTNRKGAFNVHARSLNCVNGGFIKFTCDESNGLSVRLIKDN